MIILFTGCEWRVYYNFYVTNNCPFDVSVKLVDHKKQVIIKTITVNESCLVYESEIVGPLYKGDIEYFISSIIAIHDQDTTKVNYVDKDLWDFQAIDDNHANCYLEIDSVDFRQALRMNYTIIDLK